MREPAEDGGPASMLEQPELAKRVALAEPRKLRLLAVLLAHDLDRAAHDDVESIGQVALLDDGLASLEMGVRDALGPLDAELHQVAREQRSRFQSSQTRTFRSRPGSRSR